MQQIKNITWFTLIEMMVALSIFFILMTLSYIPYSYYEVKQRVKTGAKEVSQILYEARNMAINGQSSNDKNVSVGVFLDGVNAKNTVTFFTYPYTFTGSQIVTQATADVKVLKILDLPKWVQIDNILWQKKALFFFNSITWEGKYYWWDATNTKIEFPPGYINIQLSFKGATQVNLQRIIKYYTYTNIIDY